MHPGGPYWGNRPGSYLPSQELYPELYCGLYQRISGPDCFVSMGILSCWISKSVPGSFAETEAVAQGGSLRRNLDTSIDYARRRMNSAGYAGTLIEMRALVQEESSGAAAGRMNSGKRTTVVGFPLLALGPRSHPSCRYLEDGLMDQDCQYPPRKKAAVSVRHQNKGAKGLSLMVDSLFRI